MTDRTASATDAAKRNAERDMADAHATARARDARVEESFEERAERYGLDWDVVAHLMSEQPTRRAYRTRTQAIDPETGTFTPLTQENPMTKTDRHDELVAPIDHRAEAERLLSQAEDTAVPMTTTIGLGTVANTHVLLAMLDLLDSRLTAPRKVDPDLAARNIAALKHELETPMREHGECCEPAPADDLPGEPVEPGDLRAGDRIEYDYEGLRYSSVLVRHPNVAFALCSEIPDRDGSTTNITSGPSWCVGISDVRLIERAPREDEDDPNEALARVIFGDAYGSHEGLRLAQLDVALMAREHIEAEQEEVVATLREEVAIQTARAEQAETERGEWREVAARYADGRDKWQAKWRESGEARERAEAERDGLRERLDALRADLRRDRATFTPSTATAILARDDEHAAKGGQR